MLRRRRARIRTRRHRLVTASFVGGVVAGLLLWSVQIRRSRRDLFSPIPLKRLAALGYLGGESSPENVTLLTEYIRWETKPVLRKRAERLLRRMQGVL
jgi:hypothetical protein